MILAMYSKKLFLWPVLISIIGHIALIAISSMVDLRENLRAEEIFTVGLAQYDPLFDMPAEEENGVEKEDPKPPEDEQESPAEAQREDTVNIGSMDIKYASYLASVKKKITRVWRYPAAAYTKSEEGVVLIKFTIEADGSLSKTLLSSSSGFNSLDLATLDVVRYAAPFRPLPSEYHLTRLHIVASFNYRMKP